MASFDESIVLKSPQENAISPEQTLPENSMLGSAENHGVVNVAPIQSAVPIEPVTDKVNLDDLFDSIVQAEALGVGAIAEANLKAAKDRDPKAVANAYRMAIQSQLPPGFVEKNPESISDYLRESEIKKLELGRGSPILARQLNDPDFAVLAKDDVQNLSYLENSVNALKRAFVMMEQSAWAIGGGVLKNLYQANPATSAEGVDKFKSGMDSIVGAKLMKLESERRVLDTNAYLKQFNTIVDAADKDPNRNAVFEGATYALTHPSILTDLFLEVLPSVAVGGFVGSAVTAPARAAILEKIAGEAMKRYMTTSMGISAITAGAIPISMYGPELAEGLSKGMSFDDAANRAITKTGVETAVNSVGAFIPVPLYSVMAPTTKAGAIGGIIGETLKQGALGSTGAWAAAKSVGEEATIQELILEFMGEGVTAPADIAVAAMTDPMAKEKAKAALAARQEMIRGAVRSSQAINTESQVNKIVESIQSMQMPGNSPEKATEYLQALFQTEVDESNPMNTVYFKASDISALAENGIDMQAMFPDIAEQILEASVNDGFVKLDASDYFVGLYGHENITQALNERLRFDPNAMSGLEAREWERTQADSFKQEAERLMAQSESKAKHEAEANAVYENFKKMAMDAGRSEQEANASAILARNFAAIAGFDAGLSPEEFSNTYLLGIKSGVNEQPTDALNQIIGPKAKGVDLQAREVAKTMVAGRSVHEVPADEMENIRAQTGWYLGRDNQWRTELSDADAKLINIGSLTQAKKDAVLSQISADFEGVPAIVDLLAKVFDAKEEGDVVYMQQDEFADVVKAAMPDATDDEVGNLYGKYLQAFGDISEYTLGGEAGRVKLGDVLSHEKLFDAYPGLKDIDVVVTNGVAQDDKGAWVDENGYYGSFNPASYEIKIVADPLTGEFVDAHLSTMIHEIQHFIQAYEGFMGGGGSNIEAMHKIRDGLIVDRAVHAESAAVYDELARVLEVKMLSDAAWQFKQIAKLGDEAVQYKDALINSPLFDADLDLSLSGYAEHYSNEIKKAIADLPENLVERANLYESADAIKSDMQKHAVANKLYSNMTKDIGLLNSIIDNQSSEDAAGWMHEVYKRLLGEEDARITQDRLKLSDEERLKTPLVYEAKPDDIIVVSSMMGNMREIQAMAAEKSRLERAKSMGFDVETVWYHGTNALGELTSFSNEFTGKGADQWGSGFYFTNEPRFASGYAQGSGAGVVPVYLKVTNPMKIDARDGADGIADLPKKYQPTRKQIEQIIKLSPRFDDEEFPLLGDFFEEYWSEGNKPWMVKKLAEMYVGKPIDHIEGDLFGKGVDSGAFRRALAKVTGYDGLEVTFKDGHKFMVAFQPEQIRSVNAQFDESKADSGDILFQAESPSDLVVMHNLSEGALLHALKMGGLAVPSLAVTKKENPLTSFGEITLIGDRNLIDPRGYAKTKVFGADIYSPRYPSVEYQFSDKTMKKAKQAVSAGEQATESKVDWGHIKEDTKFGVRRLAESPAVIWQFLMDKGIEPRVINHEGIVLDDEYLPFVGMTKTISTLMDNHEFFEAFKSVMLKRLEKLYTPEESKAYFEDDEDLFRKGYNSPLMQHANLIMVYQDELENGLGVDKYATQRAMRVQVQDLGLEQELIDYAQDFMDSLNPDEKIYIGRTYEGNARYIKHTIDNVVKLLKKNLRGGEGVKYGVGNVRAMFTPQFKSIKDIKAASERLISSSDFINAKEAIDNEFIRLRNITSQDAYGDAFGDFLTDAATIGFDRALKESEQYGLKVEGDVADEIKEFMRALYEMPTEYFEAKITRSVDLSEFSGAVVPNDISENVIDALKRAGITDIKRYDQYDKGKTRAEAISEFGELFFQNARGQIQFPVGGVTQGRSLITLFENANASTLFHEMGHYFFEVYASIASKPNAPQKIIDRVDVLLEHAGIGKGNLDVWMNMPLEERRQAHEIIARSFEAYLFEGNAPSIELRAIFADIKRWMVEVYKSIVGLNVEISDEVRSVFDSMLASQEAIDDAKLAESYTPLFESIEQSGLNSAQWEEYKNLDAESANKALEDLDAQGVRNLRWLDNARSKVMRDLQRQGKDKRIEVRNEVRRDILTQPVYKLWYFLSGRVEKAKPNKQQAAMRGVDVRVDNIFTAVAKLGGINRADVETQWGFDPEDKIAAPVFGKPVLRKNNGMTLDDMGQALADYGYLPVDEHGKFDMHDFEEAFFAQHRGDDIFSLGHEVAPPEDEVVFLDPDEVGAGKLNLGYLKEVYGVDDDAIYKKIPKSMIRSDGWHPLSVANAFGFGSVDEMMIALADVAQNAKPNDIVEAETDARMLEQYGEFVDPAKMKKLADELLNNEARAKMVAIELNALSKMAGKQTIMRKAAKEFARESIGGRLIRSLNISEYRAVERKAAKLSAKASKAGDIEEAAKHKRVQLLNIEFAREVREAKDFVDKALTYFKKFDKASIGKTVDPEYLEQILAILDGFDLRKSQSNKSVDRVTKLQEWIEAQEAMGLSPQIDSKLVDKLGKTSVRNMTVDELRGLFDSVKSIEALGRLKKKLLVSKSRKEFEAAVTEIESSISENANRTVKERIEYNSFGEGLKDGIVGFFAAHRKIASIVREMDGGKDGGAFWEYFIRPMNWRGDFEASQREKSAVALKELFDGIWSPSIINNMKHKLFIPEINMALSREGRLAIALNWGNETNRLRVMDGDNWTGAQVEAIIKTLTEKEWLFVQGVWDYIDSYWPMIAEKEKRVSGIAPEKVDAMPFSIETADGKTVSLRGGYYPIKADPNRSTDPRADDAVELAKQAMRGMVGQATTRRGHTKARGQKGIGPVRKDLGVVFEHVDQVIHDLAWHEWLIDANRLMNDSRIVEQIQKHYGPMVLEQIRKGIQDIAAGDVPAGNAWEGFLNHARAGSSIVGMGWSLMTGLLQPFGITQSFVRVGPKWVGRGLGKFIGNAVMMESTAKEIYAKSEFMRLRGKTMMREINEIRNRVQSGVNAGPIAETFFYLVTQFQKVVDIPTWLGAYDKAIAEGNDEARAIDLADQAVLDAQGGGHIKDLALIQRGSPLAKLFTNFYSFFNTTYNLMAESYRKTKFKDPLSFGRFVVDALLLLTVPAILAEAMREAIKGGDDCDDDFCMDKIAKWQLNYLLGTMVGVREFSNLVSGYDYSGPAGMRLFNEAYKLGKQIEQGEVDEQLLKALNNTAGVLFHYPAGQVQRTVQGMQNWMENDSQNPMDFFVGPRKE